MNAPTEAQLRDPKWWDDNAPEGATHAIFGDFTRWLMLDHGIWRFWEGGWWSRPSVKPAGEILARPTKPAAPEWDGEGLPPVGCECEYRIGGGETEWYPCTVKYVLAGDPDPDADGWRAVVWCPRLEKDQLAHLPRFQFRPLRTKEQREAYELANCINSQVCMGWEKTLQVAEYVVAAGWRKAGDE